MVQYQTYDPPVPYEASFATPQEHGTTVLPHWLLLDVSIVFCCMALVGIALLNTVFRPWRDTTLRWFSIFGYGILAFLFALAALFVLMIVVLSFVLEPPAERELQAVYSLPVVFSGLNQ